MEKQGLNELAAAVHENAVAHGWWEQERELPEILMSYGIQRDKAARMAARVGEFGSYEALFSFLRPSLEFWQMGAAARMAGRTIRQAARAFGDMFAAMGTALAACFSPALRGYVDDAKEREQKQADFSAAGKVLWQWEKV